MTSEEQRDYDRAWHLDKRVNIGHIVTTLALAVGLFAWAGAVERKVAVLEAQVAANKEQVSDTLLTIKQELRELRDELRTMNRSLNERERRPRD
jgi:TolA-binding protein